MKETGIYGGSFNPIHKGHVQLAETICQEGWVDEVWFLVSPQNPFKQDATDLMDEQVRLSLAQIAVRNHPRLKACDFEFSLPRPSSLNSAFPARLIQPIRLLLCVKLTPDGGSLSSSEPTIGRLSLYGSRLKKSCSIIVS